MKDESVMVVVEGRGRTCREAFRAAIRDASNHSCDLTLE